MNFAEQIAAGGALQFWWTTAFLVAVAGFGFVYGFRRLHRARLIEDTPTARIRSAQQGYVELRGNAWPMAGVASIAPLTGVECCWYRFSIERRGNRGWGRVRRESSGDLFLLKEGDDECLIDPEGAEVIPSDRSIWYGSESTPRRRAPEARTGTSSLLVQVAGFLNRDLGDSRRYRYTEERIYPGDPLYAIGEFRSLGEIDHRQGRREIAAGLLHHWKQDQHTLLARYDRDRNGRIDAQEWEQARRDAMAEAGREYRRQLQGQPLHRLGAGKAADRPFILSALPEATLVRRLRWQVAGGLGLFFVAGGFALYLLMVRLSW
ncbi:MAG TPA: hypothetical protein ENK50_00475 [Sedimenticola sp.]|nr:hypothetical protein [Sedimenticola sp.]